MASHSRPQIHKSSYLKCSLLRGLHFRLSILHRRTPCFISIHRLYLLITSWRHATTVAFQVPAAALVECQDRRFISQGKPSVA
jgi:hypothetical protein